MPYRKSVLTGDFEFAVNREFEAVERAMIDFFDVHKLKKLYAEPTPLQDGMIAFADGTTWNPGSGEGVYRYDSSSATWIPFEGTSSPGFGPGYCPLLLWVDGSNNTPSFNGVGLSDLSSLNGGNANAVWASSLWGNLPKRILEKTSTVNSLLGFSTAASGDGKQSIALNADAEFSVTLIAGLGALHNASFGRSFFFGFTGGTAGSNFVPISDTQFAGANLSYIGLGILDGATTFSIVSKPLTGTTAASTTSTSITYAADLVVAVTLAKSSGDTSVSVTARGFSSRTSSTSTTASIALANCPDSTIGIAPCVGGYCAGTPTGAQIFFTGVSGYSRPLVF